MNTKPKTGGPAFPAIHIEQRGDPAYSPPTQVYFTGITVRDWFAGQALQGLLAANIAIGACIETGSADRAAADAYAMADAMLKQRSL